MLGQQTFVNFTPRFETSIRGDMMLVGNNIVNRVNATTKETPNDAFTGTTDNNAENMQYIDIDNDPDTFSSSAASLSVPNASRACYKIVYAGLYWSGVYTQASLDNNTVKRSELGNIKFKLANETTYNKIAGTLIYDYYDGTPKNTNGDQVPYAYYSNVTDLLKASKNPEGEYTVANINSARGKLSNGGYAAGWSLFVIYEDPNSSAKYITAYDGFSWIQAGGKPLTYSVSGFKTIPSGNVKVKLAFAALEGDAGTTGDTYSVNLKPVYTTERKTNNFFCSVINDLSGNNLARRPASTNTLGFDAGIINLNNANNAIINNGDKKADLQLTTSGDGYGVYFNAFNVEVIAPQIALTKIVKDTDGNDIGGKNVTLGQQLRYEISIQNKGNDDATSLFITDQLPINVIFDQSKDLLPLPAGIIVKTPYDPITRKIVFEVTDPKLITKNNPTVSTIAFKVQVVPDCRSLSDACSNSIDNQAFATYKGKENANFSIDETAPQGSVNSTDGCAVTPKATNFLVGVDGCQYTENVTLCTDSVDLIPAKGYETYTWYSDAKMTNKIGEGNPFNVTKEGTYYVYNLAKAPCRSISQSFVVTRFKSTSTNPVIPFASEVVTCADNGKPFPNIYLCGGNAKKEIKTSITDASNIVWERFVEGSCTVTTGKNCPNEALTSTGNPNEFCKWEQVGTGSDYSASEKGKYRLTVTYKGGVCFNRFYFDVYKNPLTPTEKHTDIICSTNGSITVEGVPDGYEYAISKDPNGTIGAYQPGNVFPISTPGSYTVHVRQTNVTTFPCDFTVENILIRKRDIDVKTVIKQPLCAGAKGSVDVAANNVNPNYTFVIKQGSTTVQSVGPISQNTAKFDLLAGDYVLTVTTADGCSNDSNIQIVAPDPLTATYDVKSLTACEDGEITINPKGGTSPYFYSVNGQPYVSSDDKITVKSPGGSYSIIVADSNDCTYTIPTFSVNPIAKPTVTINSKNLSCYNAKEGEISMTVTPADSGYTVSYSVAGVAGGAYTSLPTTGLAVGDYKVTVKYAINGVECTDPEQIIKITGPGATLTASAGVAELSGCGPTGNTKQGMVRITNPQGGVPFPAPNLYRYSFDGGDTYITDNFAYINPSTTPLTLYIKDAAGCIFPMSGIILDEKPADPTFSDPVLSYNCKGEGTATVTVNADASPNYNYSYYLGKPDPANPANYIYTLNTNSPSNIFKDIPVGDYKIKVEYNLVSAPTYSNLLKEDFGSGPPTTAPGIASAYCFNDQRVDPPYLCKFPDGTPSQSVEDNAYSVASFFWRGDDKLSNNSGAWFHFKDHTTNPNNLDNTGDPNGRYLLVNVGNAAGKYGILYSKPIVDVIPNQDVIVDFYIGNLLMPSYDSAAPIIRIELIDSNGKVVARDDTGEIAPGLNHPDRKKWVPISIKLNPGANTNLTFVVRSGSEVFNGNDLVIDDIWVRQLPKSCLQDKTLNLKVQSGQAFTAEVTNLNGVKCKDDANGTFSIVAKNFDTTNGFWYTLNGSATTPTWVKSTTSPVVFTDKAAGTYDIRVKYDNSAASCNFTIPTIVTTPDAFVVDANATTATCKVGATVTATAVGGTGSYTLTIKDVNSTFSKTFPSDGILKDIPPGTYIVSGVDANGCKDARDTDLIILDPVKPTAEVVKDSGLCFGTNAKITIKITGGVGKYTYQVSTNGGVTYSASSTPFDGPNFTYIAAAPATYDFLITDSNNCEAIAVSQKIDKAITATANVTAPLTCKTGIAANATIEVKIDGGTAPYTYTVTNKATNAVLVSNGTTAGPSFTYPAATAATYVFEIKDINDCPIKIEKTVNAKEEPTATFKAENVTCFNAGNGYVDITAGNGTAPFTYQFNKTGAFTSTTHYGPLAGSVAGTTYTFIVKDATECTKEYTFQVFQPADIVANASITTPYDCTSNAATITSKVTAGGNTGGFTYDLKNTTVSTTAIVATNTTGIFSGLTVPGTYTVTITDSKSCSKTVAAGTIVAPNPPKGMDITPTAVTCPSNTANAVITNVVNAAGDPVPTAGLEYRIKLPVPPGTTTYQTSNTFNGLAAGITYTFEVRDANKCVYEKTLEIKALPVITVTVKSSNNISCLGSTDGSAVFTVTGMGNNVAYSYKVGTTGPSGTGTSPNAGTSFDITIPNLAAGTHTITVTNTATTCFDTEPVTIAAPLSVLKFDAFVLTPVTCDNKGTATINVSGGWGTYNYTVTQTSPIAGIAIKQTTKLFSNLNAGDYSVLVKDLNGCEISTTFTIAPKVDPVASIDASATDLCAGGAGATITVTPNMQTNYMYSINNGTFKNNGTFTGLIPGEYIVTVKDISTGCSIQLTKQVVANPVVVTDHKITKKLDCSSSQDAVISVTIGDGYPDYRYRVNINGAGFPTAYTAVGTGVSTFTYPASTSGSYVFEILDSKGCKTGFTENVAVKVTPDFTADPIHVKCFGALTGKITVTATPASGTYEYSKDGTAWQASNEFLGIGAGSYTIYVRDTNTKCAVNKPITVNGPAAALTVTSATVTKDLKCGANNASQAAVITVVATGGTPFTVGGPYRYTYNTGNPLTTITLTASNTFTINAPGLVNITVTDANGCTVGSSATVAALTPPSALAFSNPVITCDVTTGNLKVDVTGGKLPLKYEITSYTATAAPTGGLVATNVNANTYTFNGLVAGTYNFTITDDNGCTVKGSKTIDPVVSIQEVGKIDKPVSCAGLSDGRLIFTVSGNTNGTTGYTYSLVGAATGTITTGVSKSGDVITYSGLKSDSYTFSVTNTLTKCEAHETIVLANPNAVNIVSATGPKVFCDRNNTTITVDANGGTGTLYYAVVKGGTTPAPVYPTDYTTAKTFPKNTLVDGLVYDVYVRDANGCPATTTATIVRDDVPTIVDPAVTCFKAGGTPITVTIDGTVYVGSTIQYGIDGVYNTNPIKTISAPGDYVLSVKDNNGCEAKKTLHVNNQLTLTVTPIKDVTCTATLPATINAKVVLSAGGGNSTYTYGYRLGTVGTFTPILPAGTNEFYTSAPGSYYFNVISDDCEAESTVVFEVTNPIKPAANADVTNLSCYQSADGVVTIIPTAGEGPFTYTFNNGTPTTNATFSNLAASTGLGYPYTITDSKGCQSDVAYAKVTEPAQIQFAYTTVDMLCPGPSLGSLTVSAVTTGVGPYTYELRNAVTGSIIVTGQNGITPYKFDNLSYGDFVLTVSDVNGCSNFKDDVKILAPPNELDIDLSTPIVTCADGATIIVEVKPLVVPAIPLYEFGIYNLPTAPFTTSLLPPDTGFPMRHTFKGLTPGVTYTFVVYDPTTNCYYFQKANGPIDPLTSLASVATSVPVACKGTKTGGVNISLSGTTATQVQYEIFFDNSDLSTGVTGTITMPTTVPVKVLGLKTGTYYVKFTEVDGSSLGCTSASLPFVVTESSVALTVSAKSTKNDNCKNNAGQVVATPNGGTGPFKYIINQSATPPLVTAAWSANNANIFNVEAGSYYVWVKDAYDCINFTTVTVDPDPVPVIDKLVIVNKCAAEGAFEVEVSMTTQGVAPYYISVNGSNWTKITGAIPFPYTITGLNSGPVNVIIKDSNDCQDTDNITITPTPIASAKVTKVLNCNPLNAVTDATITITIEKGTPAYSYEVKKGTAGSYVAFTPATTTVAAGVTTITYTVAEADADTYQFRITDVNTCSIVTAPVTVDAIVPTVLATPIEIQPLCNGVAELGSVEIGVTSGEGPFKYSFNGSLFTDQTLYPVVAGPYTYKVRNALGCEVSGSGTLGTPSALAIDAPIIVPLSCGPANAPQSATVTLVALAGSGTAPYKFSFNNSAFDFNPTYTVNEADAGKVIPYGIQDSNGCEVFSSVTIAPLTPPKGFTLTPGLAITCTRATTTATISLVIGGAGTVSYQKISPTFEDNGTDTFAGLLPDVDYVFQVTDANKCTVQKNLRIDNYINIDIKEESTVGITCSTAADGKASFYVSGFGTGIGTYRYEVDGATVAGTHTNPIINLTGLAAGPHDIEVFDSETDCHKLITFTIAAPPAALVLATSVVTPLGCTTFGAVTLTAAGGWGDYTYTLTQPDNTTITNTDGIFKNLIQPGKYDVSVKDANSCTVTVTDSFELLVAPKPTLTIATTSDYCYYNTNSTTLVITAASTSTFPVTFEYSIDNGDTWHTSNTFDKLTPKTYLVKVRDQYGCESAATSTEIKSQLFASVENKKDIFCTGTVNGTIRVSALGGYPDYSYTVTYNGVTSAKIPFGAGFSFVDYPVLAANPGSYVFTVYDSRDCSYPIPAIVMTAPAPVVFTAAPTSAYCAPSQGNISNGSILFTLTSTADPKYTYSIQRTLPTAGPLVTQDTPLFTGLIAGTYAVNVTSGRDCGAPTTVTINDPSLVVATATAGAFTCASPANTLNATVVTVTGVGGAGSGALGDYTYSEDGTHWKTTNKFNVIDNESPQTLTYYVRDANGCIDSDQITVDPFPTLKTPTLTRVTQIACGNSGEEINVQIKGGSTPYNFNYQVSVDGGAFGLPATTVTGNSFTYIAPLAGHIYHLKINDLNTGCFIISDAYTVPLFNTAKVIASPSEMVSCFGNADGKITISITDYKGPYTYQIYNAGIPLLTVPGSGDSATINPFTIPTGLVAGTAYTVSVTETNYPFCTIDSDNVIITQPDVIDLIDFDATVVNQNCRNAGAVITVDPATIKGGSGGFTFAFVPAGTAPLPGDYKADLSKTIVTATTAPLFDAWDVYVKDKNDCPAHVTVNVSLDPMPVITNVTVASQCYSTAGYRIDVAANGVGPLEYSLDGIQFQADNFFTVFSAGDYTVTVRDKNKCEVKATTPVKVLDPLTLRGEVTTMSTCTAADGVITLYAGGGSATTPPSYVYTRDNWNTISLSPVFGGLAPGTYIFKVRDTGTSPTCELQTSIEIEVPRPVTGIVATATPTSCNGYADGSISVEIATSNDNPIYWYSLSGPVVRAKQKSPIFNDLPFGTYTVTVTSGRGCIGTAPSIVVAQPAPIVVAKPNTTQYTCATDTNTALNATITIAPGSVTGGSNSYIRYEFIRDGIQVQNDTRNSFTETDYLGGDYIINVYDTSGCQGSYATVTIDPYVGIADLKIDVTSINCKDDEAIQVTAIATSGTLPTLTYTIVGTDGNPYPLTPSATGLWANLKVGNYKIVVTNPLTGCSIERYHIVNEPNTFKFVASNIKNITCFTDADGAITLTLVDNITTPKDEAGRFSYVITHESGTVQSGATTTTELKLSNLKRGKYTVVATLLDSPFCEVKTEFRIAGPATELEIKASKKDITCVSGNDDGEIRISAQGGWSGDYLYKLDGPVTVDFSTQNIFSGLKAGLYTVSVKDAGGCIDTDQVRLVVPTPIAVTALSDKTLLLCNGDLGATITATLVTGGQGSNYLYTLNTTSVTPVRSTGPQSTPSFAGLGAGTYTVTVTDGYNCSGVSAPITIKEPSEVKPSLIESRKRTCRTDTQLTLSAIGGTPPYTYSSDNVTYSTVPFTTSVSFDVAPGAYKYYVKDANGCVDFVSNEITISAVEPLLANLDVTNAVVLCREDLSGVIVAKASGGLGNYQYILQDGAGNILKGPQSDGRFSDLLAGDYKVVVKSGDCETLPESVKIDQPKEVFSAEFIPTAVKCFGGNDGQIVVIGKGGTGSYKYSISPRNDQYFDSNIFEKLKAGFYTVIATDEHGCYDTELVEVKQPSAPLSIVETPGMTMPEECVGDLNGAFTIDFAGGTPPYMVSLDNLNGTYQLVTGTQHTFENLAGGIHTVFVKDNGNCPQELDVDVPKPVDMNPTAEVSYECVNNTQANMVTITIDASITNLADVDYALDGAGTYQAGNIFTNLAPGNHYVTARHTNGCEMPTASFEIKAYTPLGIKLSAGQPEMNVISVTGTGGAPAYEYSFNGEPFTSSNTYKIYKSGDYVVVVRDQNGCTATITVPMVYIDVCLDNYFTPNGDGVYDTWGPGCTNIYNNLDFSIFDRYGRVIAKYHYGQKWDGRYNGEELPSGDYWYVLKLNDEKDAREFVGHFTLYR
ncbi:hypothetical protein B0A65_10430 [Flavobacterium frigidimaris]|uniref:Gliding motility-associated C-terminal domain-containing protein n=2 Tax=Flavobacterium frigidimaris TaxID=262320 RepID=A0ABX4BRV7_FLAFR|nr:hypothetical protein B0A65_10430 [Flavobacterium frigidimaris]